MNEMDEAATPRASGGVAESGGEVSQMGRERLIRDSMLRNGIHYGYLGDDGDRLYAVGHPGEDALMELMRFVESEGGNDPDEVAICDPEFTWGQLIVKCPRHRDTEPEDCRFCRYLEPGNWLLDWHAEEGESNEGKPGFFPIVIWETGW